MIRRLFWAVVGIGLGAVVGAQVMRSISKAKARYAPPALARGAMGRAAMLKERLTDAIAAGAEEMARAEADIRTELDLPPSRDFGP